MATYEVKARNLTLTVDGNGPFICSDFKATQTISEGYIQTATFMSETNITDEVVGCPMEVNYEDIESEGARLFKSIISEFVVLGFSEDKEAYFYEVVATDPFYFLSFCKTNAIYQKVTTKQCKV